MKKSVIKYFLSMAIVLFVIILTIILLSIVFLEYSLSLYIIHGNQMCNKIADKEHFSILGLLLFIALFIITVPLVGKILKKINDKYDSSKLNKFIQKHFD